MLKTCCLFLTVFPRSNRIVEGHLEKWQKLLFECNLLLGFCFGKKMVFCFVLRVQALGNLPSSCWWRTNRGQALMPLYNLQLPWELNIFLLCGPSNSQLFQRQQAYSIVCLSRVVCIRTGGLRTLEAVTDCIRRDTCLLGGHLFLSQPEYTGRHDWLPSPTIRNPEDCHLQEGQGRLAGSPMIHFLDW